MGGHGRTWQRPCWKLIRWARCGQPSDAAPTFLDPMSASRPSATGSSLRRSRARPQLAIAVLALFNPTIRAVKEVLYQSEQPFVVDHSKYAAAFGSDTTPHREAIRETLNWYRQQRT